MLKDLLSGYKYIPDEYIEVRAQLNAQQSISLLKGNLVANISSTKSGISARVYKNGLFGFASAPEYNDVSIDKVIKAAAENAEFLNSKSKAISPCLPEVPHGFYPPVHEERKIDQSFLIDTAKEIDSYITKNFPDLASRFISAGILNIEKLLYAKNSYGTHSFTPRSHLYVGMTVEDKNGAPVEMFVPTGDIGLFDSCYSDLGDVYKKINELYYKLRKKAEGIYAEAGERECILDPNLAGILSHEAVGHTVEADLVMGGSVAAYNLNKQVASELVTMVDFANHYNGKELQIPVYVDDEGTLAEDTVLIKDGILRGYMHDKSSAAVYNTRPTGNARAYTFSDEPLIRMRNTAILPGKDKLEDMISSVKDGYYLVDTGNGQADYTGEFMFGVNFGYEIKNGKLGRAIKDTTISGVAFDMLKTVSMISDDMKWCCTGMCGKKQPIPVSMGGPAVKCRINIGGR